MSAHSKSLAEISFIYLIIGISGALSYYFLPIEGDLGRFFAADLVMTVVTYFISVFKKNSSVYDAYWSVIPFYFLIIWWLKSSETWGIVHFLTAGTISFWSWRLTYNWYRSWTGWEHEDWRYVNFRNQFGKHFQWINFLGIHLYPTCIVFLGMTGLFWLYDGISKDLIVMVLIGNFISLIGILLEFFADNTLYQYRNNPNRKKGTSIREGLWKYSRNPNYLGEILFWVGLAVVGLGAGAPLWTSLGAVGMILMFIFASIPMKEKRLRETRTDFDQYKSEVSMLIPLPPKYIVK